MPVDYLPGAVVLRHHCLNALPDFFMPASPLILHVAFLELLFLILKASVHVLGGFPGKDWSLKVGPC